MHSSSTGIYLKLTEIDKNVFNIGIYVIYECIHTLVYMLYIYILDSC